MKREIRLSEKLLIAGFTLILLFMIVHDWVPLGTLNDVEAIAKERSIQELLIVTLVGVVQILILMGLVLIFMGKKYPIWVKLWLIIHQGFILQVHYSIGGFHISSAMVQQNELKDMSKCSAILTLFCLS